MLRAAVADIAGKFGHDYFAESDAHRRTTEELWQALAEPGFLVGAPARGSTAAAAAG